jgi:hypothetical protein
MQEIVMLPPFRWSLVASLATVVCCHAQALDTLRVREEADALAAQGDSLYKSRNLEAALKAYESTRTLYSRRDEKSRQAAVLDMIGDC